MRGIAKDIKLDVEKEHDLITLAQFHVNEKGGRHRINQTLISEFAERAGQTENHKILASLPIRTFWTTNYDTLIEDALRSAHKRVDVKVSVENLATTLPRREAVVYKMHGDVSRPDEAVVTKDDYEAYNTIRQLFSTALQGDLVSKTVLFIGFSFNDPNLGYILSRIRVLLGKNRRDHYCLFRRVQRADFDSAKEFNYARARQDLQVRDLRRYGIIGLLVDTYDQYTEILSRIQRKYRMSRVFIGGSAASYAPWGEAEAQNLIQELSRRLLKQGFGIVSGFGLGVGAHVVNGVVEQLDAEGTRVLDDRIVLRPFPYAISDADERRRKWTAYREDMLDHAGIAIFLFGNKDARGGCVIADGMIQEFEIAVQKGIAVIPVGCTGSGAAELHGRVLADFNSYFPSRRGYKTLIEDLAKPGSAANVVVRIMRVVTKLRTDA
jgi:hypothetical protein